MPKEGERKEMMQIKISDKTIERLEKISGDMRRHGGDYILNKALDVLEGKEVTKRKYWNSK